MTRDSRYDVLFEPVRIGPVTAPNRFYQVPHCSGMGHERPNMLAAMRGMKAQGGWGVVCTEYCSIDPSSDDVPYPHATLWDDGDVGNLAALAYAVHEHGSLAGVELWHGGSYVANLLTRQPPLGVVSMPSRTDPIQSQPMDRADIKELRAMHRAAARRARQADFDIVYVYATHGYLLWEFLSRSLNGRTDCYGGTLENRVRLIRELVEETREEVGDRCAVAVRMSGNGHGESHLSVDETVDMIGMLRDATDLFDLVVADYSQEMGSSRFFPEGSLEEHISHIRAIAERPVVSVGRFTSPDTMVSQIKRGVLDFIGAARPSIADPFLPKKIETGAVEDIRECIGCNICYSGNSRGAPIRCTQNPTMGEEWRADWHPETVSSGATGSVLIVGAGPAGLEAAHILGKRGFDVALADAAVEPGGRVTREGGLPGLREWTRVKDYRLGQIGRLANVELYLDSRLDADHVREFDADQVVIATGARWRSDGIGRSRVQSVALAGGAQLLTPDDVMDGVAPQGPVVVFDDDHYYMGTVVAEALVQGGAAVTYVTSAGEPGAWSTYTEEQERAAVRLLELGVDIRTLLVLKGYDGTQARFACVYSGTECLVAAEQVVSVTGRVPDDALYRSIVGDDGEVPDGIVRIGDCRHPSIIAAAVHAGHRFGREYATAGDTVPRRDRPVI